MTDTPDTGLNAGFFKFEITLNSPQETRRLGKRVGQLAEAGLVIILTGELGSGKTVFVQGLGRGLEIPPDEYITSPTFTLINCYPGRRPLYHVDLYRLDGIEDTEDIGLEELLEGDGVVAIEWGERLKEHLPPQRLEIHITISGSGSRIFRFKPYGRATTNLVKEIKNLTKE